jgi:hypothetical protein
MPNECARLEEPQIVSMIKRCILYIFNGCMHNACNVNELYSSRVSPSRTKKGYDHESLSNIIQSCRGRISTRGPIPEAHIPSTLDIDNG